MNQLQNNLLNVSSIDTPPTSQTKVKPPVPPKPQRLKTPHAQNTEAKQGQSTAHSKRGLPKVEPPQVQTSPAHKKPCFIIKDAPPPPGVSSFNINNAHQSTLVGLSSTGVPILSLQRPKIQVVHTEVHFDADIPPHYGGPHKPPSAPPAIHGSYCNPHKLTITAK